MPHPLHTASNGEAEIPHDAGYPVTMCNEDLGSAAAASKHAAVYNPERERERERESLVRGRRRSGQGRPHLH